MVVEKENILRILEETKKALAEEDTIKLKDLSNQTLHSSSMTQDASNVAVGVIIYSLSKIVERKEEYKKQKGWEKFYSEVNNSVRRAHMALSENKEQAFKDELKNIRKAISDLSGRLREYISDVFQKAKINKASKIYEHGISMEKTAKMLGITLWELANYAGQRGDANAPLSETLSSKERIKLARGMFE